MDIDKEFIIDNKLLSNPARYYICKFGYKWPYTKYIIERPDGFIIFAKTNGDFTCRDRKLIESSSYQEVSLSVIEKMFGTVNPYLYEMPKNSVFTPYKS